jgi:hypothetical protein
MVDAAGWVTTAGATQLFEEPGALERRERAYRNGRPPVE